jgi:hypothetical protein
VNFVVEIKVNRKSDSQIKQSVFIFLTFIYFRVLCGLLFVLFLFFNGEVRERLNRHDWKSCVPSGYRGFESHPLRFLRIKIKEKR